MFKNLDVIIPTYNRAKYLKIALESLFESTAQWRKTIILNNASIDNTLEVIEKVKSQYPDRVVEVITNATNIGNVGNFKRTQELAENDYTAVFHDDDAIHPEYVERAMMLLMKNPEAALAVGTDVVMYNVNHDNWDMLPNFYIKFPSKDNAFYQLAVVRPNFCTAIYKTDAYKQSSYQPEKYGKLHDICFLMDVTQYGSLVYLQGVCVRRRQHISSDSNTLSTGPFPEEVLNVLLYIQERTCVRNEELSGLRKHFNKMVVKTLIYNFSYFLYQWSMLCRFLTWDDFCDEMCNKGLFSKRDYRLWERYIDTIWNPQIRKQQRRYKLEFREDYDFRLGG